MVVSIVLGMNTVHLFYSVSSMSLKLNYFPLSVQEINMYLYIFCTFMFRMGSKYSALVSGDYFIHSILASKNRSILFLHDNLIQC